MDVPRTLLVTNDYAPKVGGIQRTLEALVRQLPPDRVAVLTEPLAIGLHGILANPPKDSDSILIIGGGMIAFSAIWSIRAIGCRAKITQLALLPYQLEVGRSLGADEGFWAKDGQRLAPVLLTNSDSP